MSSNYKEISGYNEEQLGKDRASRMSQVAMYSETAHFVYELLQNADDAEATEIKFSVSQTSLVVEHNGKPFTEDNVKAISYFGKGKTDITKIGHFGLGFKSVFAYTASPRVHSGDESFEITELYSLDGVQYPSDLELGKTRFIFPFDHELKKPNYIEKGKLKAPEIAYSEIAEKLSKLSAETLLFTKSLSDIRWETECHKGHFQRKIKPVQAQTKDQDIVKEMYIVPSDGANYCYLIVERPIEWPGDDGIKKEHRPVQIAFRLDKRLKDGGLVKKVENARLFVFFPTVIETHVGFILQGPYRTTPQRETVPAEDEFNRHVVEQSASLLSYSLGYLRDLDLLNVASYAALPLRAQDFPESSSLFRPVYDRVREALKTQPLLPADGGGFIKADEAKIARGEDLVKLFSPERGISPEQLGSLFGRERLKWLDATITENGETADLHTYLIGRKKQYQQVWEVAPLVEGMQVDADTLAPKLTADFLVKQPMEWLTDFIQYAMQGAQSLRKVPFIRLASDGHVSLPPDKNVQPSAWFSPKDFVGLDLSEFPLIHAELAASEPIRKFLEEKGIREIDAAAIVGKCILPLYNGVDTFFDEPIYRDHLRQIRRAYTEANDAAKKQLTTNLDGAAWLACIHASGNAQDKIVWKKPGASDVFTRTNDHEIWFHGLDSVDAYFLHSSVNDELNSSNSGLVKPATVLTQNLHPDETTAILSNFNSWHKRGVNGFKPDAKIIGLQSALDCWNQEKALILWRIMLSAPRIIRGETQSESNRQRLDAAPKNLEYTEVGNLCRDWAWLPDRNGEWRKPSELFLSDLTDGFDTTSIRAKEVADKLGMKRPVSSETIDALGFNNEEELRRAQAIVQSPDEFREFEEFRRRRQEEANSKPALPNKTSPAPQRREEKIAEETRNTPEKTQETRERTVDPDYSGAQGDARTYLEHQYTNDDGVMFCQLCQAPQPVMLNGEPHFEAVDCVGAINAHHEQNNLALCPNHAAMYKNGGLTPDTVQRAILGCEGQNISLNLAGNEVELYFTQQHLGDLRAVLAALDIEEV